MHNQFTADIMSLTPVGAQVALGKAVCGENPEFYSKVAAIKRGEELTFMEIAKYSVYSLLDKVV